MHPELTSYLARREAAIATVRDILNTNLHVQARPDAIDPDAPLFGTGLALDSVDALELVVATESAFGVTLPQVALRQGLRTVNALIDLLLDLQDRAAAKK